MAQEIPIIVVGRVYFAVLGASDGRRAVDIADSRQFRPVHAKRQVPRMQPTHQTRADHADAQRVFAHP